MNITDVFAKRIEQEMKNIMSRGLSTSSPLWKYAKVNAVKAIGKELGVRASFNEENWEKIVRKTKHFPYNNNDLLININRLFHLKDYFNRFTIVHGHKFFIRPAPKMADILNDYKVLDIWEKETTEIVEKNVKEGMTCVDIGASVGYFTLLFGRLVGPKGKVIAIEPTDFQQPYLRKNIKVNGYKDRVIQVHCGAWDKDEIVKMPRNAPRYCQFELRCRPTDDILEELGVFEVDFMKIDVDGPEPKVLKGLERTFLRSPNLKMVVEFYPKYIEDCGCSTEQFNEIINKYFTFTVIPDDYTDGCWNLLCTRKCKKELSQ
jgi:FkbM family methyltransferase